MLHISRQQIGDRTVRRWQASTGREVGCLFRRLCRGDDRELVAADTRDLVLGAQRLLKQIGERAEDVVAVRPALLVSCSSLNISLACICYFLPLELFRVTLATLIFLSSFDSTAA